MEITQKIVALKLPEKYRFAGGVMGNGLTLGLTNGTQNAGVYDAANSVNLTSSVKAYGTNTGAVIGEVGGLGSGSVGITTDPAKSGIVLETDEMAKTFIAY